MLIKILIGYLLIGAVERWIQALVISARMHKRGETTLNDDLRSCDETEIDGATLIALFGGTLLCWLTWPIWMVYTIADEIRIQKELKGN